MQKRMFGFPFISRPDMVAWNCLDLFLSSTQICCVYFPSPLVVPYFAILFRVKLKWSSIDGRHFLDTGFHFITESPPMLRVTDQWSFTDIQCLPIQSTTLNLSIGFLLQFYAGARIFTSKTKCSWFFDLVLVIWKTGMYYLLSTVTVKFHFLVFLFL